MALYIDYDNNSLIFNKEEFTLNTNYIPEIVQALRELNPKVPIYVGIDLEETPLIFIVFFQKLKKEVSVDIRLYFKDTTEMLPETIETYGYTFNKFSDFPYPLTKNKTKEKD